MIMIKTSHTFYSTDSRQVFIQRIADKHVFMVGIQFCGLDIVTNDPNGCFVCVILFYLISVVQVLVKIKIDKDCLL